MNKVKIKNQVRGAVARASFSLPADLRRLLVKARAAEKNKRAKQALGLILENAAIAQAQNLAICQDTGLPLVFIEAGKKIKLSYRLIEAIKQGVEEGYRQNYLRASCVCPLPRSSSSYKGGIFHLEFSQARAGLRITILPKGFGSENKSQLKMFNPTASREDIEEFVLDVVRGAGPEACPPFVVGVGIGGTSDQALLLAKKAWLGRLDKLGVWERRLLKRINSLKIGPMGFGGRTTCLSVKVKTAPTHIAGLPVGVNISCHALRRATVKISA